MDVKIKMLRHLSQIFLTLSPTHLVLSYWRKKVVKVEIIESQCTQTPHFLLHKFYAKPMKALNY